MADDLELEIEKDLKKHARWQSHDFIVAQALMWMGIITSAVSALQAAGVMAMPNWAGAVFATIPGIVIVVDKTFKYSARSSWHAIYCTSLRALRRDLRDRGVSKADTADRYNKLEVEMAKLFPPLDSSNLGKSQ